MNKRFPTTSIKEKLLKDSQIWDPTVSEVDLLSRGLRHGYLQCQNLTKQIQNATYLCILSLLLALDWTFIPCQKDSMKKLGDVSGRCPHHTNEDFQFSCVGAKLFMMMELSLGEPCLFELSLWQNELGSCFQVHCQQTKVYHLFI